MAKTAAGPSGPTRRKAASPRELAQYCLLAGMDVHIDGEVLEETKATLEQASGGHRAERTKITNADGAEVNRHSFRPRMWVAVPAARRERGTQVSPSNARPRERRESRPRQHGSSKRSSAKSGDSGSESESSEPPSRRLCAFCGNDIPASRSPKAEHCSDKHAANDRKRRQRQRDRARDQRPLIPTTADFRRMREITADELARLRSLSVCHCNGRHQEFEPGSCHRCGHWLPLEVGQCAQVLEARA
jgi:hypothetical protein